MWSTLCVFSVLFTFFVPFFGKINQPIQPLSFTSGFRTSISSQQKNEPSWRQDWSSSTTSLLKLITGGFSFSSLFINQIFFNLNRKILDDNFDGRWCLNGGFCYLSNHSAYSSHSHSKRLLWTRKMWLHEYKCDKLQFVNHLLFCPADC